MVPVIWLFATETAREMGLLTLLAVVPWKSFEDRFKYDIFIGIQGTWPVSLLDPGCRERDVVAVPARERDGEPSYSGRTAGGGEIDEGGTQRPGRAVVQHVV
jgi:hypothetical protein